MTQGSCILGGWWDSHEKPANLDPLLVILNSSIAGARAALGDPPCISAEVRQTMQMTRQETPPRILAAARRQPALHTLSWRSHDKSSPSGWGSGKLTGWGRKTLCLQKRAAGWSPPRLPGGERLPRCGRLSQAMWLWGPPTVWTAV